MKGVQLRSESNQGASVDDTAVNGLRFLCTDNVWKYPGNGYWGSWSSTKYCPDGSAVIGIQTQFEENQGEGVLRNVIGLGIMTISDDTALNDAIFYCAKIV